MVLSLSMNNRLRNCTTRKNEFGIKNWAQIYANISEIPYLSWVITRFAHIIWNSLSMALILRIRQLWLSPETRCFGKSESEAAMTAEASEAARRNARQ